MNWLRALTVFPVFSNITSSLAPTAAVANMSDTTAINQAYFK